jgi:uncharacterized protein YijF (DUF1287 family)
VLLLATLATTLTLTGLPDRGIYPELTDKVSLSSPDRARASVWVRLDPKHRVLTLYDGVDALKAYATNARGASGQAGPGTSAGTVATLSLTDLLAGDDLAEVARLTGPTTPVVVRPPGPGEDLDGDGVVDRLDILLGAKKLLQNGARYHERYVALPYPGGDVPRGEGVCSDTVIRALRNAGIDLQREVHEDLLRAPAAYPMVDKIDASINHRRVKTLLPWFKRHFVTLPDGAPYLPGDVVFFDTFPSRPGPDHLGVVSDTRGRTGLPLVINNWSDGATDAEMDLLPLVPVTHHFRVPTQVRPPRPAERDAPALD